MKTKAIIFDKDGTLLDFDAFWVTVSEAAIREILDELHVDAPVDAILRAIGVEGKKTSITGVLVYGTYSMMSKVIYEVLTRYGYDGTVDAVSLATVSAYHRCVGKGEIKADCADIVGVLTHLKEQGIKLAVVTADGPIITEKCLKALGIADCFDRVYTDDGVTPPKPDPFCVRDFCRITGVKPEELVMVGDTMIDMDFAKNGNIRAVGIAKDEESRQILSEATDTIIPDISRLFDVLD